MDTEYGKAMKHLRIDKGVTMREMAKAIGVSASYLSKTEKGLSSLSDNVFKKIVDYFQLDSIEEYELKVLADDNKNEVRIPFDGLNENQTKLAKVFARNLPKANDDFIKALTDSFINYESIQSLQKVATR